MDPFFLRPPMFGGSYFPMLGFPSHGHNQQGHHGDRQQNRQVATMDPFSMLNQMDQMMNETFSRHHRMMSSAFGEGFMDPGRGRSHRALDGAVAPPGRDTGGHYHTNSTVMHFSNTGNGTPTFYHATSSETSGPGGVKETRKTEADSRTGKKKMAIGHHVGEQSHTIEKRQDMRTKEMEEHQQFVNLNEDDAETFDKEWTDRTRSFRHDPRLGMPQQQRDRFASRRGLGGLPTDIPGHTPGPGREQRSTRSRSPEKRQYSDGLPMYPESEAQRRKEYLKSKHEERHEKKVKF